MQDTLVCIVEASTDVKANMTKERCLKDQFGTNSNIFFVTARHVTTLSSLTALYIE